MPTRRTAQNELKFLNADEISRRLTMHLELQKEPDEGIRDFLAGIYGISSEVAK